MLHYILGRREYLHFLSILLCKNTCISIFLKYNTIKLLHIFNKIKFIYKITQKQYEYVNKDMNFSMIYNNFIYNFIKLILYF
jgi:hypothetical protein